jgi:glycerol-3-phosphate dehydrogenase
VSSEQPYDLLVIGGGINGAGIARDAAGRGYRALLCEARDLGAATSSASTKLIHGGLRYLEHYEFRLVREALAEREVLMHAAPHIIWPLRFVLPHSPEQRPAWLIRLGLLLYDHLGGRQTLPSSRAVDLHAHAAGDPLQERWRKAFVYSDGWVQDARLVVLNALDARERGAEIATRTQCLSARPVGEHWEAELADEAGEPVRRVRTRAIVNAAGPWVNEVLGSCLGRGSTKPIRLVKGSHIVVRRLFDHAYPYIFQNEDKRIVFAIPYEDEFTLIGTTEEDYGGDPAAAHITEREVDYLCAAVNRYFGRPVAPEDVVWSYAGVRPLYGEMEGSASATTRDYVLELDGEGGGPLLLSVFGGKITTYRKLAEHAMRRLDKALGRRDAPWTAGMPLPGGDIPGADYEAGLEDFRERRAWLPLGLAQRYFRNYGTRAERLLGEATEIADLGRNFGGDLYEAEVDYLVVSEFARTAEDILWRRSKLGLHLPADTSQRLDAYLEKTTPRMEHRAIGA